MVGLGSIRWEGERDAQAETETDRQSLPHTASKPLCKPSKIPAEGPSQSALAVETDLQPEVNPSSSDCEISKENV